MCSILLSQDNVALIAVLEALEPPFPDAAPAGRRQLVCVANTHIHANPELGDVKLWQVGFHLHALVLNCATRTLTRKSAWLDIQQACTFLLVSSR